MSGARGSFPEVKCGCCGADLDSGHECFCMVELLCKTHNRCVRHCGCALAEAELPYPDQLLIAREEWAGMGVFV